MNLLAPEAFKWTSNCPQNSCPLVPMHPQPHAEGVQDSRVLECITIGGQDFENKLSCANRTYMAGLWSQNIMMVMSFGKLHKEKHNFSGSYIFFLLELTWSLIAFNLYFCFGF